MNFPEINDQLDAFLADGNEIRKNLAFLCAPTNKTPVEAADDELWINDGSDVTKFLSSQVPYMRKPLDSLARRIYEAVIVMGPARSGKTKAMIEGWINYAVTQAPGDMLLIYSTKTKASDMSKIDLERCFNATEKIKKLRTGRKTDDNITSKRFKNGMNIKLDSATETSLSASTYRYAGATDYDRSLDGVGQEGSKFELMLMRCQNAKSSGMVMAESSPGRIICAPKPNEQLAAHETQAAGGIAELYNQGDRQCFYWLCDDCGAWFRPVFETLKWDELDDPRLAAKTARVECPRCCHIVDEEQKQAKNLAGSWFKEGEIDCWGMQVTDESKIRRSKWASFAFEGVIATYASWENLVYRYLSATQQFEKTGDEAALISFFNVRIGRNYIKQSKAQEIGAHELRIRAEQNPYERAIVPMGGRFLIMSVDVQGGKNSRFVVQAQIFGQDLQRWVIDRFEILTNPHRGNERVNPAVYAEDWDLLVDNVMKKTYPLADGSGRVMKPILTLCDSGGAGEQYDGKLTSVTDNAYQFYNRLKPLAINHLFRLVKGSSREQADLVKESYPDKRSDLAHGEIPLWVLHTNRLKNRVAASFERLEAGSRFFWLPSWAKQEWFDELTAEYIDDKGNWKKPEHARNESFDLCAYAEAGMHKLGGDDINWQSPPNWAAEWGNNPNVVAAGVAAQFEKPKKKRYRHSSGVYG